MTNFRMVKLILILLSVLSMLVNVNIHAMSGKDLKKEAQPFLPEDTNRSFSDNASSMASTGSLETNKRIDKKKGQL